LIFSQVLYQLSYRGDYRAYSNVTPHSCQAMRRE
jgi:hypothetical protein